MGGGTLPCDSLVGSTPPVDRKLPRFLCFEIFNIPGTPTPSSYPQLPILTCSGPRLIPTLLHGSKHKGEEGFYSGYVSVNFFWRLFRSLSLRTLISETLILVFILFLTLVGFPGLRNCSWGEGSLRRSVTDTGLRPHSTCRKGTLRRVHFRNINTYRSGLFIVYRKIRHRSEEYVR